MVSSNKSSSCLMRMILPFFCFITIVAATNLRSVSGRKIGAEPVVVEPVVQYGTQCSFAITGPKLDGCGTDSDQILVKQRQQFYNDYMNGCYQHYNKNDCIEEELTRLEMNQRQPQSMVNMTTTGYMKTTAPASLMKLLTKFWEQNKEEKEMEEWGEGSIYTNHWKSPTHMVDVGDEYLEGGGKTLKKAIWDAAVTGMEEWTGGVAKLRPVSLYGIREYTEGAVLSPHVDRVPLVSSGIVNVAQDVDEDWPLEVYDRNGHAVNITMKPGDMILYESHSLIHGRPFPLKGRYYANVFIHFEPFEGWDINAASDASDNDNTKTTKTKLGDNNGDLPPYILPGSPEEAHFRRTNPNGWSKYFAEGEEPPVTRYAADGLLQKIKDLYLVDPRLMWFADENGWTPLHEACRAGHLNVVQFLIDKGAGVNDITGDGLTALRIAINYLGTNNDITKLLVGLDAEDKGESELDDAFDAEHDDEYDDDDDDGNNDEDGDGNTLAEDDDEEL